MNILFLTSRFPTDPQHFTLEKELVYAFNKDGHNCTVANILERRNKKSSHISYIKTSNDFIDSNDLKSDIKLLNIKTGNLFNNVNILEKKLTALSLPYIFPYIIKKLIPKDHIDLIIAYGPYLCGHSLINPLKKYFNCKSVLVQWDIFPQNAYDLGIIKNKLIVNYFKYMQKLMFKEHDLILCNSEGNVDYLKQNFPQETQDKLFLFHNCEAKIKKNHPDKLLRETIRKQHNIPINAVTLIFGGNIGVPQELENIINLAAQLENNQIYFLIIGQGTQARKIKQLCANKLNIKFIDFLPSQEYEQILQTCDFGIISLSPKFTVPNFPAKVTSYIKIGLPIFACLDNTSYNDLGRFILANNIGYAVKAENISASIKEIKEFLLNSNNHRKISSHLSDIFDNYFEINKNFGDLLAKINKTI